MKKRKEQDEPVPELGGPDEGRFGRAVPEHPEGGVGFGGPLGRHEDRADHEQGRLFEGDVAGAPNPWTPDPPEGESSAGRGHVGTDDYRDLEHFGRGTDVRTKRRDR